MPLKVQLVAAHRAVWSGEASMVIARTVDGDIGIMPGHVPLLAELATGVVTIHVVDGDDVHAALHGGFISVENDKVSLLAEVAELAEEIDVEAAKALLERASATSDEEEARKLQIEAETQLRAAESRTH
jgi:F-type H+-transporting ATPase subunit epsilon